MKKNKVVVIIILVLLVILLGLNACKNNNYNLESDIIYTDDDLYSVAIRSLYEEDDDTYKNEDGYKLFIDYHGFGVTRDNEYKYAYMWIDKQAYFVKDGNIISSSGSSMPYKFRFDENNIIMEYENPKDGNEYTKSIREMFPNEIENEVLNFTFNESKIMEEVKNYYSYLDNTRICYLIDGEIIGQD